MDQIHDRIFITIVVLFVILFCFNWASLGLCWLCCFRSQQKNWGKFHEMAPLRKLIANSTKDRKDETSIEDKLELSTFIHDEKHEQNGTVDEFEISSHQEEDSEKNE